MAWLPRPEDAWLRGGKAPVQASSRAEPQMLPQAQTEQPRRYTPAHWRVFWRNIPLALASLPMLLFFLLPLVALLLKVTPAQLLANYVSQTVALAIQLSLRTTLTTTGITVLAGTPV